MFRSIKPWKARVGVLAACGALVAASLAVVAAVPAWAAASGGVGATLPYVEVQAENSSTNGTVIGPSADYNTLAAESSYRKAVTLQGTGKFVEFTTPAATNSIVFRYSIPDTGSGSVYTPQLSLYVNGTKQPNFTLTNAYSWYYGGYPFTNSPGSNPHHFYDEVHRLFPTTYPAGTKFRLQVDSEDTASSYTIDFADFENVAGALTQPAGSVSVTSTGADPTGAADSTAAFNSAMTAAGAGGTVWIPEGTFRIPGHLILNNITIKGAGMWRSTVVGAAPGFYGNYAPNGSSGVHLSDFAIFGDVQERNDGAQVNGIGGALNNSTVDRVWIEHEKVGAWMDGPFTNLVLNGMRIRNVTADGVNFHNGVTNSKVTNSDLRNLGDDGLATWAEQNADVNDSFDHNTVQYPILANGIAIYGGHDNFVTDNRVIDAGLTQGGGIHVAQRFASTTLGRTDVLRNTIIRSGSLDPELAVRGRGTLVRRAGRRDVRPDQRRQHPHRAEPVRGRPIRLGLEHQQRQDQQRDDPEHRNLGGPGAGRRLGDHHQQHRHRYPGTRTDLQLWRRLHAHRRRRQLGHLRAWTVSEHHRAGVPAVPAGQRIAALDQPERAQLRLRRDRYVECPAGRHRHEQRYGGGAGQLRRDHR